MMLTAIHLCKANWSAWRVEVVAPGFCGSYGSLLRFDLLGLAWTAGSDDHSALLY